MCGESEDGKLGFETDEPIRVPKAVSGINGKVVSVACGGTHTVAITSKQKQFDHLA